MRQANGEGVVAPVPADHWKPWPSASPWATALAFTRTTRCRPACGGIVLKCVTNLHVSSSLVATFRPLKMADCSGSCAPKNAIICAQTSIVEPRRHALDDPMSPPRRVRCRWHRRRWRRARLELTSALRANTFPSAFDGADQAFTLDNTTLSSFALLTAGNSGF